MLGTSLFALQEGLVGNELRILALTGSKYIFLYYFRGKSTCCFSFLCISWEGRNFVFIFIFASSELWIYAQIIGGVITSVSFQFCLFWLSIWHTMSNQDCILNSIFSIIHLVENFSKARANIWCCCQTLIFLYSQGYFKGKWKKVLYLE